MKLQRIDRLSEAPIVGQFYLVPVVHGKWHARRGAWPVMGPQHSDPEFFSFPQSHYHIDGRFLTCAQRDYAGRQGYSVAGAIQASPLMMDETGEKPEQMPKASFMRRRCIYSSLPYMFGDREPIPSMRAHFAGQQCAGTPENWICPHRKAPLGSVTAVDGVITCPLHGLLIDAATGLVMAPPSPIGIGEPQKTDEPPNSSNKTAIHKSRQLRK